MRSGAQTKQIPKSARKPHYSLLNQSVATAISSLMWITLVPFRIYFRDLNKKLARKLENICNFWKKKVTNVD